MTIPLDRLYHYIEDVAQEVFANNVLIYRFYPHGSKKISDLQLLTHLNLWKDEAKCPEIYCNDQEPLNYDYYEQARPEFIKDFPFVVACSKAGLEPMAQKNFRRGFGIYKQAIVLHSEMNSPEVIKYENNNFVPVYYWSHAMIGRDWFRYAEHVKQKKQSEKKFLIYNRAWAGSREYRLKFSDLVIDAGLVPECKMTISACDPDLQTHYRDHKFNCESFVPNNTLENYFSKSSALSHYSADFDLSDYESTDVEIVLETLFDDQRWHLTEKTLRPIACGQPFVLASSPNSLQYLKKYGFKTFDSVWNENYDTIQDPLQRLHAIVNTMKEIASWDENTRQINLSKAKLICEHNKQMFFSQHFLNLIKSELKHNLILGFQKIKEDFDPAYWMNRWNMLLSHQPIQDFVTNSVKSYSSIKLPTMPQILDMMTYLQSVKNA